MDIEKLSLKQLAYALDNKEISSEELVRFYLERINKYDSDIKAFLHVADEHALREAQKQDELRSKGDAKPGAGIPVAVKDILVTKDMPTTCASKMLEGFISPYNASVVNFMKSSGYIMLGKTNMDEFAMGSSGETSYFQKTANPWNLNHVPGGSSSGSAAVMAARMAPVAIGSDTGGSIRQPASYCGVVGFKPSYGTVSRYGAISYASSMDQIGPIAKSVEDVAYIMDTLSAYDPLDPTAVKDIDRNFSKNLIPDVKGVKFGLPKNYINDGLSPQVKDAVFKAIDLFVSMGAELVEIDMPHDDVGLSVYQMIANAEASSNLARYDGIEFGYRPDTNNLTELYMRSRGEGFGYEVKKRIFFGTYVLQKDQFYPLYMQAMKIRRLVHEDHKKAFSKCDFIIGPTAAATAFEFGSKHSSMEMYLNDLYTVTLNLNGSCGISIPCGFDVNNMPIGLQLKGDMYADQKLLSVAHAYQLATDWHLKTPEMIG